MRKYVFALSIAFVLLNAAQSSAGGITYLVGSEAAVEATAQVFASPALPSLDNEVRRLTPMVGLVSVKGVDDTADIPPGQSTSVYDGELKGNLASLTFSSSGNGDFGYFVVFAGTKLFGAMTSTYGGKTDYVKDISSTGYTGIAGASYRMIGDAKSGFALGVFAGPGAMSVKSNQTVVQSDATTANVSTDSKFYGVYGGIQLLFRLSQFRINPYVTTFKDLTDHCRNDVTVQGNALLTAYCINGQQGFEVDASILGVGLNIGNGPFNLNVYSEGIGTHHYLKATSYALSYGINF
jgi:hypothetical protein